MPELSLQEVVVQDGLSFPVSVRKLPSVASIFAPNGFSSRFANTIRVSGSTGSAAPENRLASPETTSGSSKSSSCDTRRGRPQRRARSRAWPGRRENYQFSGRDRNGCGARTETRASYPSILPPNSGAVHSGISITSERNSGRKSRQIRSRVADFRLETYGRCARGGRRRPTNCSISADRNHFIFTMQNRSGAADRFTTCAK